MTLSRGLRLEIHVKEVLPSAPEVALPRGDIIDVYDVTTGGTMAVERMDDDIYRTEPLDPSRTFDIVGRIYQPTGTMVGSKLGVRPGDGRIDITIRQLMGRISGTVETPGGARYRPSPQHADVKAVAGGLPSHATGAYVLAELRSDGTFTLPVRTGTPYRIYASSLDFAPSKQIVAAPGDTHVVLVLQHGCSITGRVVYPDGRPAWLNGWLRAEFYEGTSESSASSLDADARFTIPGLPPGPVHLYTVLDGPGPLPVMDLGTVHAPARGVVLVVEPPGH